MPPAPTAILLVSHAFGPQSIAGTELHTYHLARHLNATCQAEVFHAVRDPNRPHGSLERGEWRGVPVWRFTQNHAYRAPHEDVDALARRAFVQALETLQPRIVHFHHLSGLSLDLPAVARARGLKTVMTLHDYHLVCPAGGQLAAHPDAGICDTLEADRCARCHSAWRHHHGALEAAALKLSGLGGGLLPSGWPFRLYHGLPTGAQALIRRLNQRVRAPNAQGDEGDSLLQRLEASKAALGACDQVFSPSRDLLRRFAALGMPIPHGAHLPNGVPDPWAAPGEIAHPPTPPLAEGGGPVKLLHIGTLAPHKGIDLMVDAAARVDARLARWTIIGSPQTFPAYTAPLLRKAKELPQLAFPGACPPEDVPRWMAQSDALVLAPRWPENAPLTVLNARAAGLPVIAPAIGGLPEMVIDGVDGLLYEPGSAGALAAAVGAFVGSEGLRARLRAGVKAPPTAAEHAQRALATYRALLGEGP